MNGLLRQLALPSSINPFFHHSIIPLFLCFGLGMAISPSAQGQTNPPSPPSSVRCPSPANPPSRYFECVGQPFDFIEETLTKDWAGVRTELSRLGITPIASYTTQLMGNPSGGQSRGFTYSGTLQTSIIWDLAQAPRHSRPFVQHWRALVHRQEPFGRLYREHFTVQSAYTAPSNGDKQPHPGRAIFAAAIV